nr:MAG TPA: hypothetical protein [Caudoviricetes sp.]
MIVVTVLLSFIYREKMKLRKKEKIKIFIYI